MEYLEYQRVLKLADQWEQQLGSESVKRLELLKVQQLVPLLALPSGLQLIVAMD